LALCYKSYRFRMCPTEAEAAALVRLSDARRWVWNWGLQRWKENFQATGKSTRYEDLSAEFTILRRQPQMAWLKDAESQSSRRSLIDLQQAFTNFFEGRARYPKFKSRKRESPRLRIPQKIKINDGSVYVPRIGYVRIRQSREIEGTAKNATFKRAGDGRWYVTVVAQFEMPDAELLPPEPSKVVGLDLGLKDFAVDSDGGRVPAPRLFRASQRRLRRAQRALNRCRATSNRRAKARARVARIYQKVSNQRGDFLHKLSTRLVTCHDGTCIEDLDAKRLARTKLAKSVNDASWGEFRRQLEYKSLWHRKHLAVIDRWFPSTRLCRGCGTINGTLTLSDREWVCGCGMIHDRDLSAAINIRDEGLRVLAAGYADKQNARGRDVRLPTGSSTG
jgi:putative transposase